MKNKGFTGRHHSLESKEKMSETLKRIGNGKWNKGRKFSLETIQKRSQTRKLNKIPAWNNGKRGIFDKNALKIISETAKTMWKNPQIRERILNYHRGKPTWNKGKKLPQLSGKNHWNWKGGLTSLVKQIRNSFKYRQWRSDIFTRDDFVCQICGQRGKRICAHHYPKSFSEILEEYQIKTLEEALACEELWNINNGITFCEDCHKLTDNYLNRWSNNN